MLNTSRNLVRCDCTHYKAGFDPHKSCYGCRFYKRPKADPCAWEGPDNCVACQELSPELKERLQRTFAKRLARRCKTKAERANKMATLSFDEGELDEREASYSGYQSSDTPDCSGSHPASTSADFTDSHASPHCIHTATDGIH